MTLTDVTVDTKNQTFKGETLTFNNLDNITFTNCIFYKHKPD